jgi:hypothetical protein
MMYVYGKQLNDILGWKKYHPRKKYMIYIEELK